MDAELILLRLFGHVRSHFCVSTRPVITHYRFGMPRVFQSDRRGEATCGWHDLASRSCQPKPLGLILWTMLLHPVSPAQTRCCCMRSDAGAMGDLPAG